MDSQVNQLNNSITATHQSREVTPYHRDIALIIGGVAVVLVMSIASVYLGVHNLAPTLTSTTLLHKIGWSSPAVHPQADLAAAIVGARLDRTWIAALVGVCVGIAGALFQGTTRNLLADPGILGINAGAALCIVCGIRFFNLHSSFGYVALGFVGALVVTAIIWTASAKIAPSRRPVAMVLIGAALTAGASSLTSGLLITDQASADQFRFWQVGSVAGRDTELAVQLLPVVGFALLIAGFVGPLLNILALGEQAAAALGINVARQQTLAVVAAGLLCACATAIAGPISFIGLIAPHLVRLTVGGDYRRVLLGSALLGPALVIAADTLGRLIAAPTEVSVGIMTALIGAPVLIGLIISGRTL